MDYSWEKFLTPKFHEVVRNLRPSLLLDRLVQERLLEMEEYNELRRDPHRTDEEISRVLLGKMLPKKGPQSFEKFCEALHAVPSQAFIAEKILGYARPVGGPNADRHEKTSRGETQTVRATSDVFLQSQSLMACQASSGRDIVGEEMPTYTVGVANAGPRQMPGDDLESSSETVYAPSQPSSAKKSLRSNSSPAPFPSAAKFHLERGSFVGRSDLISWMKSYFFPDGGKQRREFQMLLLHGLGGVGNHG